MFEKHYLIQMDCLIRSGKVLDGAAEFMQALQDNGFHYLIISEQTGRTRVQLEEYFHEKGLDTVSSSDFYTSAMAAVDYLLIKFPQFKKAAYIGGKGIKAALEMGGYTIDNIRPDVLFAGMDRNLTHKDYSDALQTLLNGAVLISTDSRRTQKIDGVDMVGNGAVVKMLEYACGKRAVDFSRGTDILLRMALRYMNVRADYVLAVGDDFRKDIIPAVRRGMDTVLVTNGASIEDLEMDDVLHPTYIVEDLSGLAR